MLAYVQIALDATKEKEVYDSLREMPEILEVYLLFGEWDLIAKLEMENPEALATFVISNIRNLPGVKLTSTMIVAKR